MADKIFVLADGPTQDKFKKMAQAWEAEVNQKEFSEHGCIVVMAVAEYLANERGLTLYERNAKYKNTEEVK